MSGTFLSALRLVQAASLGAAALALAIVQAASGQVTTGSIQPAERQLSAAATLGLTFTGNLTISAIAEDSPLSSLGLRAGDQIIAVNGRPISNADALLRGLTQLADTDLSASLTVMRNGTQRILSVSGNIIDQLAQAHVSAGATINGNISPNGTGQFQNPLDGQFPDRTARGPANRTTAADVLRQSLQSRAGASITTPAASSGTTTSGAAGTSTNAATAGTSTSAATDTTTGTTITRTNSGLIAPSAGVAPPAGTITPPTIDPRRLPGGGLDNTTEGTPTTTPSTNTGTTTGTTTPAPGTATTSTSGAEITRSPTGLVAPNAGVAPPPGTITPPTIDPSRLPGGGGLDSTTDPAPAALPTTVLTPSGPRIAAPQAQGQASGRAGAVGVGAPGQTAKVPVSPKAAPQAKAAAGAKAGAKAAAGTKAGGAARGGAKAGGSASGGAAAGTGT